ncbi:MAG: helicase, partial [Novosphingobium sp.]|nr:helicase [Novosphingobium sp.]
AAERHLPGLLEARATELVASAAETDGLAFAGGALHWHGIKVARIERGRSLLEPRIKPDPALDRLAPLLKARVSQALQDWLAAHVSRLLSPLEGLAEASRASESGANLRALLLQLVEAGGVLPREESGLDRLDPAQRDRMKKLGVRIGALDLFVPAMLRPAPLAAWAMLATVWGAKPPVPPVSTSPVASGVPPLAGYRRLGAQSLRVDLAEKLLHAAHRTRLGAKGRRFYVDPALARSMGLSGAGFAALLRSGGFRVFMGKALPEGAQGPAMPPLWEWRPVRSAPIGDARPLPATGAFAALAELVTR